MPAHVRSSLLKLFNKMEQNSNERNQLYPSSSDPLVPRAFSSNAIDEYITIEAVNPHGSSVHFKIRSHSPLEKLMRAYCSRENLPLHSVAFLYNGIRIDPHHTPHSLGMIENDIIDILLEKDWGEHFASNQHHHPSQSVPANIKTNENRRSRENRERSEPVIDHSIHNRSIHMNIHTSNNNQEKEINKEEKTIHKPIHKSIHKSKDKSKKKEVIRSENVIRMGNIAYITDCFGDENSNNNNNDINNNIFENQCKFALNNLKEKVEKVGMKLKEVGRIRVYLLNISNYEEFYNILKSFFGEKYTPIVTVVEVSKLRRPHSLLEIEADVVHVKRT